jgi:hypothetical protein
MSERSFPRGHDEAGKHVEAGKGEEQESVSEPTENAEDAATGARRKADHDADFDGLAKTGRAYGYRDAGEHSGKGSEPEAVNQTVDDTDIDRAEPIDGIGADGHEHLSEENCAGLNGMAEEPLPHGMAAALEVELHALALADHHDEPQQEHEGGDHLRHSGEAGEMFQAGLGNLLADQATPTVVAEVRPDAVFDVFWPSAVALGGALGFALYPVLELFVRHAVEQ